MKRFFILTSIISTLSLQTVPPTPPLLVTVQQGDCAAVKTLVQNGTNLNVTDDHGRNALHCAAEQGQTEIVKYLLEQGLSPASLTYAGETPLHLACRHGHPYCVQLLVQKKAPVNSYDYNGKSPLLESIMGGHIGIACFLMKSGANVNAYMVRNSLSPLSAAVDTGNFDLVQALVLLGANVNFKTNSQPSPLFRAIKKDLIPIAYFLIENGADVHEKIEEDGYLLSEVCKREQKILMRLMIKKGAGVILKPSTRKIMYNDELQLHEDVLFGYKKEVEESLADQYSESRGEMATLKTDIDCRDADGLTTLHKAVDAHSLPLIDLLLQNGASIDAQDRLGRTPLHKAAQYALETISNFLLSKGANENIVDTMKKTSSDYCSKTKEDFPNLHITAQAVATIIPKKRELTDEEGSHKKVHALQELITQEAVTQTLPSITVSDDVFAQRMNTLKKMR